MSSPAGRGARAQLAFLEVGVDIDAADRDDGHQRRAGCTRWPTWTWRLVTTPSIGARITVRSRSSRAWSSAARAAATSGLVSTDESGDQRLVGGIGLLRRAALGLRPGRPRPAPARGSTAPRHRRCGQLVSSSPETRRSPARCSAAIEVDLGLLERGLRGGELGTAPGRCRPGARRPGPRASRWLPTDCCELPPRLEIGGLGLLKREAARRCRRGAAARRRLCTYCVSTTGTSTTAAATSGVTCAESAPT